MLCIQAVLEKMLWRIYLCVYDSGVSNLIPRRDLLQQVCDELKGTPGRTYLDLGCGTGDLTAMLHEPGGTAVGIDISESWLRRAKRKYGTMDFRQADADRRLDQFADNSFDGIASVNVVYLLKNRARVGASEVTLALTEIHRLLKEGGTAVVVTPCYPGYSQQAIIAAHVRAYLERVGLPRTAWHLVVRAPQLVLVGLVNLLVQHRGRRGRYRFFKPRELLAELKACGFCAVRLHRCYAGQNLMAIASKSSGSAVAEECGPCERTSGWPLSRAADCSARLMQVRDIPHVLDFLSPLDDEFTPPLSARQEGGLQGYLDYLIAGGRGRIIVCERRGELAGLLAYRVDGPNSSVYISLVAIKQGHRAVSRTLVSLIRFAVQTGRHLKPRSIIAKTWPENERIQRLMSRLGFRVKDVVSGDYADVIPGGRTSIVMECAFGDLLKVLDGLGR
jgi:SAM-dependent methyltransferase